MWLMVTLGREKIVGAVLAVHVLGADVVEMLCLLCQLPSIFFGAREG